MRRGRWLWMLIVLMAFSPVVRAGGAEGDGPIGWWRFDPGRFAAANANGMERVAATSILRALVASGAVEKESASNILKGLLAASEVGGVSHELVLWEAEAEREMNPNVLVIDELRMTLALEKDGGHAGLLRSVRAILIGDAEEAKGTQRKIVLADGSAGVSYREPEWAGWHEVSWSSLPGRFVVGLGTGVLERKELGIGGARGAWEAHRAVVDGARGGGEVFLEAYVDLNRLRAGSPGAFAAGRARRSALALRLSNAREFMVHARWMGRAEGTGAAMIAIDVTWTDRAERPGVVHRMAVSESVWPGELGMSPPPGSYVVAMRVDWMNVVSRGLEMAEAVEVDEHLRRRRQTLARWKRREWRDLKRLTGRFRPWLVLSDSPTPSVAIPGATTLFMELWPAADAERVERDLAEMLKEFGGALGTDGDGTWWLKLEPTGTVRAPAWGFVRGDGHTMLVGGWGPVVVSENRERVAREK